MRATFVILAALAFAAPVAAGGETITFSSAWKHYVVSGTSAARGVPATVTPATPATLIWRHEVAGNLELTFGAVTPGTTVRVAFSETAEYLGIDGTSDWSETYTTDAARPASGSTWVDVGGCQAVRVCADGYRAFRFARIYVDQGSARIVRATVRPVTTVGATKGWFLSSDNELNRIWYASAYTAQLMELPNDPTVLGPACAIPGSASLTVIVDGAKRDRCPWLGDQAVTQLSLFLAQGAAATAPAENTLSLFGNAQLASGYIPASPAATSIFVDYPAYWVLAVDNLLLYRGDLVQVDRWWPALVKLMDVWYPSLADPNGLIEDPFPPGDYAYVARAGPLVAYYNALYDRALEAAAQIADALGNHAASARWRARAAALAAPFNSTFWDEAAGAYGDSPTAPVVHPQDGNAFAILSGLASASEATSALAYLDRTTRLQWGNAIADDDAWGSAAWGADPSQRVYPFISYFDVLARFAAGADTSAVDELARTWGWMLRKTDTTWEAIGGHGEIDDLFQAATSMAHGWSTGAAPALTNEVLGIRPTGPGFSTFDAIPHPADLAWAQGAVPTPAGTITFGWRRIAHGFLLRLVAPASLAARVGAPVTKPRVLVDGKVAAPAADGTVTVRGSHVIQVLGG